MKNASLVDVFRYIRQNSDYTFVYDSDAVKQMKTVSLDMKNVAIEEILEQCFKGRYTRQISSVCLFDRGESSDYQGAERRATASEECSGKRFRV